jgi:hypothetical protein
MPESFMLEAVNKTHGPLLLDELGDSSYMRLAGSRIIGIDGLVPQVSGVPKAVAYMFHRQHTSKRVMIIQVYKTMESAQLGLLSRACSLTITDKCCLVARVRNSGCCRSLAQRAFAFACKASKTREGVEEEAVSAVTRDTHGRSEIVPVLKRPRK